MELAQQKPQPNWVACFAVEGDTIVRAPGEKQLKVKAEEFNLSKKATYVQIGKVANGINIYSALSGKVTKKILEKLGFAHAVNWTEIDELGYSHPLFIPKHGCFGFINGNLILANRHHMEIMYRLMEDKGWTWDDLMNATQVWGWYSWTGTGDGSVTFSSDAGIMTSEKVKNACVKAFSDYFGHKFKKSGGYGGKNKKTFGGNMELKYGKPGQWGGYKCELPNTIISPLPDPPSKEALNETLFSKVVPGGGKKPPKLVEVGKDA